MRKIVVFQTVCRVDEIEEGKAKMFVFDEKMIGLFHINGEFFALDNQCPHAGASLAGGIIEGDCVRCRIHHWKFSIRDGRYLDADRPIFDVRTYPTRVVHNDVQIDFSEASRRTGVPD